jgi:guanine deaminase
MRRHVIDAFTLFYLATLGGAKALKLDGKIGNFARGKEADFLVLDMAATPFLKRRLAAARSFAERLFVLATLGDDRVISRTYLAGNLAWQRAA